MNAGNLYLNSFNLAETENLCILQRLRDRLEFHTLKFLGGKAFICKNTLECAQKSMRDQ